MDKDATHTWLHNPKTGGIWQCPNAAVDDHLASGWERTDPPPEPDPATAEMRAWRKAQAESPKPRRGTSMEESDS